MERVANHETLNEATPPNLLEAYADREFTIYGITAPLHKLAALCPRDLKDPSVSLESINTFVVKMANEAGLEVEAEHEELFSRIVEEQGLERKFTIAPEREPTELLKAITETEPAIPQKKEADVGPKKTQTRVESEIASYAQASLDKERERGRQQAEFEAVMSSAVIKKEQTKLAPLPSKGSAKEKQQLIPDGAVFSDHSQKSSLQGVVYEAPRTISYGPGSDKSDGWSSEAIIDLAETLDVFDDGSLDAELTIPSAEAVAKPLSAAAEKAAEMTVADWAVELSKEPSEIYEDFNLALNAFVENADLVGSSDETLANQESQEDQPAPQIVRTVAERLAELEAHDREQVAQILKNIVGAVHGVEVLEAKGYDPAEVEEQLEVLCVELFEALGIKEYDTEDVEQFTQFIRGPDFKLKPAEQSLPALDLTREGMHEAKRLAQWANSLFDTSLDPRHALGMIAVLVARLADTLPTAA